MKILHLFPYLPTPPNFGGALRVYHILKHLYKNHDVTVAGFGTSGDLNGFFQAFPGLENKAHFLIRPWRKRFRRLIQLFSLFSGHSYWYTAVSSPALQQQIDHLLEVQDFDVIQTEFPSMAIFDYSKSSAVKILDSHNVEYDNFRRMSNLEGSIQRRFFYRLEFEKFYNEEIDVCKKQDAIFITSNRDRKLLDKDTPEVPKFVIPNGVDMSYFRPPEDKPEPYSLVFTGMMGYVPNYEGILFFLDEIFPILQGKFSHIKVYIVGKSPPEKLRRRATDNIIVTGFVDDVRPYVWRSGVYVVPLNMGGGTRLKVLEALAMKIPVVTTSIGCEGIEVEHEDTALIADDPRAFAESVIRLIKDRKLRQRLSCNGYELVKKKYDWPVIGELMEQAYTEICNTALSYQGN